MLTQAQKKQRNIATAKSYLDMYEAEYNSYHAKTDLIGRSLKDLRDRAKKVYEDALKGIPYFPRRYERRRSL